MTNTITIEPAIFNQWIAALRSGEYSQARQKLKQGGCFCALGVLCDLYIKQSSNGEEWSEDNRLNIGGVRSFAYLPAPVVAQWAGFTQDDIENDIGFDSLIIPYRIIQEVIPDVADRLDRFGLKVVVRNSISTLNDGIECSFTEIADILERNGNKFSVY